MVSWLQHTAASATDARQRPGAARFAVGAGLAWPRRRWPGAVALVMWNMRKRLPPALSKQRARPRRSCCRPPSSRGFLLGAAEEATLSRPAAAHQRLTNNFVQVRVNARHVWSARRPRGECGTRSKMLMPERTANTWLLDEAACNEPIGRQEPPTRRKAKTKAKTQLRKNTIGARAALPTRTA